MKPVLETTDGGIEVVDPTERRRVVLETDGSPDPTPVDPSGLPLPVATAARIAVGELALPRPVGTFVRDETGTVVADANATPLTRLERDRYVVEISGPIKVYLAFDAAVVVTASQEGIGFAFRGEPEVTVGARSYGRRPDATITTTADPADVRATVEALSSALATTGPERSYPTLRRHPPLVERGSTLAVPDGLSPPETGVRVELPSTIRALLTAAPLSFYLGAELAAGRTPRLVTDRGVDLDLTADGGLAATVERVLRQAFLLDCVVRAEGFAGVDLAERAAVEPVLDRDLGDLYHENVAGRLEAALALPTTVVDEHLPTWNRVAFVPPEPDAVEALPFALDALATVRVRSPEAVPPAELRRRMTADALDPDPLFGPVRGADDGADSVPDDDVAVIDLPDVDAVERVWFGPGVPYDGTKATIAAHRHAVDREPDGGPVEVAVVCNDVEMAAESARAAEAYRASADLPFDVRIETHASTADLRRMLVQGTDLLHYVGHVGADGIRCRDGHLDVRALESVGVDAFLLNGCRSYGQGLALTERGAIGGVVTLGDVVDAGAVEVGLAVARLLNRGFPLRAAVALARRAHVLGGHYLVVGDGTVSVAQNENGVPMACELEPADDGTVAVTPLAFVPSSGGMGSTAIPLFDAYERHHLIPGRLPTVRLPSEDVERFFDRFSTPALLDGTLWFDGVPERLAGHGP